MKTLISMNLRVETNGVDWHVHDDTHIPEDITWAEAYKGMVALRDELNRQIADRKMCPFNPANVRIGGEPRFEEVSEQN